MKRDVWHIPPSRFQRLGASECSVLKFGASSEQPYQHVFTVLAMWTGLRLEALCIVRTRMLKVGAVASVVQLICVIGIRRGVFLAVVRAQTTHPCLV